MLSKEHRDNGREQLSPLEHLASEIASSAKTISTYQQQGATNEVLAGMFAVPTDAPVEISRAKHSLLEAVHSIQMLLLSSQEIALHATLDLQRLACHRWMLNFDIPDHVPLEATVPYSSVATSAGVPEDHLIRFARMAMTNGLFHEPIEGHIAHTPVSAGLRSPSSNRDGMLFLTESRLPAANKAVEMTKSQMLAKDPGNAVSATQATRTAFQIAHDTTLPFFPYLSAHPQVASQLAASMRNISVVSDSHVSHLFDSYHWSDLPYGTTIADLGGSRGHISLALAARYPQLNFIVQDLPSVIDEAAKQPVEPAVQGRVTFRAHSFLKPQPTEDAGSVDIYLIRQCLNNWGHDDAVRILRGIVPGLQGIDRRLLINSVVVPVPFSTRASEGPREGHMDDVFGRGLRDEAIARIRDLSMMQLMDGAERDLRQWRKLLLEADSRLEIVKVTKPEGSLLSLLEVKLGGVGFRVE